MPVSVHLPLSRRIPGVIRWGASKEMARVHALPVVAPMTNEGLWQRPLADHPGHPMCNDALAVEPKITVTAGQNGRGPHPAIARDDAWTELVHLAPEPDLCFLAYG